MAKEQPKPPSPPDFRTLGEWIASTGFTYNQAAAQLSTQRPDGATLSGAALKSYANGYRACPPWVVHRLVALHRRERPFCKVEFDEINRLAHLSHEEVTAINSARRMEQADE